MGSSHEAEGRHPNEAILRRRYGRTYDPGRTPSLAEELLSRGIPLDPEEEERDVRAAQELEADLLAIRQRLIERQADGT